MATTPSDDFNAARRLYEILAEARKQEANRPAREAWATILALPSNDRAALFRALAHLIELADEVAASIHIIPEVPAELFLAHLPAIRKAIGITHLDHPWETHLQLLTEMAVRDLLFCSDRLRLVQPEQKIAPDALAELRKEADALFEAVEKSDIDDELRRVLLACLESFRRAIADYRIRGAGGLREAAVKTLAELALARVNPKTPVVQRLLDLLRKADGVATKAMAYKSLLDAIGRFALVASGSGGDTSAV